MDPRRIYLLNNTLVCFKAERDKEPVQNECFTVLVKWLMTYYVINIGYMSGVLCLNVK